MVLKRNIDTIEIKPKPKKSRILSKKPRLLMRKKLEKAIGNGNTKNVKQFLKLDFDLDERNEYGKTALHLAAEYGHADIVAELLAHGAMIDIYVCCRNLSCQKNFNGETALTIAVMHGHVEVVKELLKHNPDLTYSYDSENCLTYAVSEVTANYTIVELLVAHAANVNVPLKVLDIADESGDRIIHRASHSRNMDIMKLLLNTNEFDIDVKTETRVIFQKTALQIASLYGRSTIVAQLLANGADVTLAMDVNGSIDGGDKAFHLAARFNHLDVIKEFLKHGIDIDDRNKTGRTALHIASSRGKISIVKELLEHGANIDLHASKKPEKCIGCDCENCHGDGNALYMASENGHLEVVKLLLQYGAKFKNQCSPHAIHVASEMGHIEIVKELLDKGASINSQEGCECSEQSPLILAVVKGHTELVTELLKLGADPNLEDSFYGTPIYYIAAEGGKLSILKELLKYGGKPFQELKDLVDFTHTDYESELPLYEAKRHDHQDIIGEILLYPELYSTLNDENWTSLHYAAEIANGRSIAKLLAKGYDVNLKTTDNETALHRAVEGAFVYKDIEAVSILLQNGANVNILDNNGETAFNKALRWNKDAKSYQLEIVPHTFLKFGSNIDFTIRDNKGRTPLEIVIDQKDKDLIRMITKRMCPKPNIWDSIYQLKYFL